MLQPIFDKPDMLLPVHTSQTSSIWPLVPQKENEQIIGYSVGHAAGSPVILAPRERTLDEVMEEILHEYPELFIDEATVPESVTTTTDFNARLTQDDVLIDEPLPRLPLQVLPIELILKSGGRGEPAFKMETEISIHDDD